MNIFTLYIQDETRGSRVEVFGGCEDEIQNIVKHPRHVATCSFD